MVDIRGTNGPDRLVGGPGDDWFYALGQGDDFIDGGIDGWDEVSYHQDGGNRGVVVTWNSDGSGTVIDTHGNTDTFVRMNGFDGSRFSDTVNVGPGVEIHIAPGFGSNVYHFDNPHWATVSYNWLYDHNEQVSRPADFFGVRIALNEGKIYKYNGDVDTVNIMQDMEFRGTHYNDVIEGANDGLRTRLEGMAGSDRIIAGDRHDYVSYEREGEDVGAGFHIDLAAGLATNSVNSDVDTLVGFVRAHGSDFDDVIIGNEQNNFLVGYGGDDRIDGGAGLDVVAYWERAPGDLRMTGIGTDTVTVVDLLGRWGTDTLTSIERIEFGGTGQLALDINGNAGQAYRLYQAAFDRTPDQEGLKFWIGRLDWTDDDLLTLSRHFLASDEFISTYGTEQTVTNERFVELLYQHTLGRQYEQAGYDYWVGRLASGDGTRSDLLAHFSESAENKDRVFDQISDGIWLG